MQRYLDGTNDVAFKKLFSDKVKLINLLNSLLRLSKGDRIIDLSYITTEQLPLFLEGKRSLFDLKVKDETGRWYIIEMQRKMEKDYLNRTQFYGCYTYVSQIKKGMKHRDLLPVVIISIIGTKALPDELPYVSYHYIKESNTHKQYLFSLTYVFIELGKFKKNDFKDDTDEWLHLLKYASQEQEPPKEIKNEIVLSAYASLEQYKWTDQEHDDYFRAEMAIQQEIDKFEEKFNAGMEKGIEKGKIEIIKKMLTKKIPIEEIHEMTGISIEEIKKLKAEI